MEQHEPSEGLEESTDSSNQITKLISLVEKKRILYDPNYPEYKNTHKKCLAWHEVARDLSAYSPPVVSGEYCRKKWNTIKRRYETECKKMLHTPLKNAANFQVWKHFDQLSFLLTCERINKRTNSFRLCSSDEDEEIEELPVKKRRTQRDMPVQSQVQREYGDASEGTSDAKFGKYTRIMNLISTLTEDFTDEQFKLFQREFIRFTFIFTENLRDSPYKQTVFQFDERCFQDGSKPEEPSK